MTFWALGHPAERAALVDAATSRSIGYAELKDRADAFGARIRPNPAHKGLGFVFAANVPSSVIAWMAALRVGDAAALLDAKLDRTLAAQLVATYLPEWIASVETLPAFDGYRAEPDGQLQVRIAPVEAPPIYDPLALLLSTSGTTGSPKMVRLSRANLASNAASITEYLAIGDTERAITTLPLAYSYGLSVLHSHLHAGATVVLTDEGVTARGFWDAFRVHGATSIAGVPYTWQILHRLRFETMKLPSLGTMTQAGGRLDPALIAHFHRASLAKNARFFVMYGQTEATARMTYVPPERLGEKIGAVGVPIPGGAVAEESGELVYRGPNVMLGYAEARADLARGDDMGGVLRTGDLARIDDDGYVWITGRTRRFVKLFGLRIQLDEVERRLAERFSTPLACVGTDDLLTVAVEDAANVERARETVASLFAIHPSAIRVVHVPSLPRSPQGKLDYPKLAALVGDRQES